MNEDNKFMWKAKKMFAVGLSKFLGVLCLVGIAIFGLYSMFTADLVVTIIKFIGVAVWSALTNPWSCLLLAAMLFFMLNNIFSYLCTPRVKEHYLSKKGSEELMFYEAYFFILSIGFSFVLYVWTKTMQHYNSLPYTDSSLGFIPVTLIVTIILIASTGFLFEMPDNLRIKNIYLRPEKKKKQKAKPKKKTIKKVKKNV